MVAVMSLDGAKARMGRKKKPHGSRSIRVHDDVARMIGIYAKAKEVDAVDFVSEHLRPWLESLMPEVQAIISPPKPKKDGK